MDCLKIDLITAICIDHKDKLNKHIGETVICSPGWEQQYVQIIHCSSLGEARKQ